SSDKYFDLTYKGKVFGEQDASLKLFHTIDRLEFVEAFNPLDKDTNTVKLYGIDGYYSHRFCDILRAMIGYTYQENKINSSVFSKHNYNFKGLYFESELDLWQRGSLVGGLRWDNYSNFGDRVNPKGGLSIWLYENIKLRASYGKSFRAPTFNEIYWPTDDWGLPAMFWPLYGRGATGNTNLDPEKSTSVEAGFTGYFFDALQTDVTFFKTKFNDLITWAMDEEWWWRPSNVNSATIKGAELEVAFDFNDNLRSNFSYTYLEAIDVNTKKWLINRPRHFYKLKVLYSVTPQLDIGLGAAYKTKRFTNPANTFRLKHYYTIDLDFNYEASDHLEVLFAIKNIFDQEYQEQRGYPLPGRTFYGGLKLTF
ncbi:MAG: TonB-dependent receptor, partial [Candidatus Omnitrophota bacterium]